MTEPVTLLEFVRGELSGWPAVPDKLPWDDPDFSHRMLAEHLSQAHDHASRRAALLDRQVAWLHQTVLGGRPARILDLGCGPGLYTQRLAALGHECSGIDFAPAAIAYAQEQARVFSARCSYRLGDLRTVGFGQGFDLVLLLFGELNALSREDARHILRQARRALGETGLLLLEVQAEAAVRAAAEAPPTWRALAHGLFSARPHLRLDESRWDEAERAAVERFTIVDAETAAVRCYGQRLRAYSDDEYRALLDGCGFRLVTRCPNLDGTAEPGDFPVLLAQPAN